MAAEPRILERDGRLEVERSADLRRMLTALSQGEYVVVSGSPASGVTTFLTQADRQMALTPGLEGARTVWIDRPRIDGSVFAALADPISEVLRGPVKRPTERQRRLALLEEERGAAAMLRSACGPGQRGPVIVLVDHFQSLALDDQRRFLSAARRLREHVARGEIRPAILLVIAGAFEWDRLDPERTSPFSNAATKIALADLDEQSSAALAQGLLRRRDVPAPAVWCSTVHEHTLGHTYLTQRLCALAIEHHLTHGHLPSVEAAAGNLVTEGDEHLRELRARLLELPAETLDPLVRVLKAKRVRRSTLVPDPDLDRLLAVGLLVEAPGGRIRLRNRIYSAFLRGDALLRRGPLADPGIAPYGLLSHGSSAASAAAYRVVHRLENELRSLVASTLHEAYGADWPEQALSEVRIATEKHGREATSNLCHALALRRRSDEAEFGEPPRDALLDYATIKELELVVLRNWGLFRPLMKSQDAFRVCLTSLGRVRNRLAHNRAFTAAELERLGGIENTIRRWSPYGDEGPL